MRIYFASQSFYPHIGGVSTYLLNLARELKKRGNEVVEVHLRPSGEANADEIKGIEIHRVPKEPLDREMLKKYSRFKEAIYKECHGYRVFTKKQIDMEGYDEYTKINHAFGEEVKSLLQDKPAEIVHIHDFQLLYLYKYIPRGTPLVLTWHVPFPKDMSKDAKEYLIEHMKNYDKVVFSSEEYIDAAVEAGLPKEKTALIYPICNTNLFRVRNINRNVILRKYRIPAKSKVILCVQRIDPKSGHEQLIRAMPLILKKVPEARLVFTGSESMSNKLSKDRQAYQDSVMGLIKKLKLSKHVIFTGNVEYTKLPRLYNAADVVALTSRIEGFGLSVTEGMACGKPIVGTNAGGIPLQVEDNVNGYLVDVGDYNTTAKRIIHLLNNGSLRQKFGENSLQIVDEKFRMDYGVDKHIHLYSSLLRIKNESWRLEKMSMDDIKAIITDYDRTITDKPGIPVQSVMKRLEKADASKILVTGRKISYVRSLIKKYPFWRCVVAENGAIIYFNKTKKTIKISSEYMERAREIIRKSGIRSSMGDIVISISLKDRAKAEKALGDVARKLNFIVNVDEVMILPKFVNKGKSLKMALDYLNIEPESTVIIGDAENDIDLFNVPGFKVAVANAHEKLKMLADQVTENPSSKGVIEVIEKLERG